MTQGQSSRAKVLGSKGLPFRAFINVALPAPPGIYDLPTENIVHNHQPCLQNCFPPMQGNTMFSWCGCLVSTWTTCYIQHCKQHTQNMLDWCMYKTFSFQSSTFCLSSLLNPVESLSKYAVQKSAVSFSQTIKLLPVTWELNICYLATREAIWECTSPLPLFLQTCHRPSYSVQAILSTKAEG